MEEARRVLERLERIERLRTGGGSRVALLAEVRELLAEGEAWVESEAVGTERAARALDACRSRLAGAETSSRAPPSARRSVFFPSLREPWGRLARIRPKPR